MHEITVKAWMLGLSFFVGFGVNELLSKLIRYIETFKK